MIFSVQHVFKGKMYSEAQCTSGGPNRTEFTEYRSFGSVLFGSVRFGEIQKYQTESLQLFFNIFPGILAFFKN